MSMTCAIKWKGKGQILQWMSEGKYELTEENYKDYISNITEFYCNYDYDSIFVD